MRRFALAVALLTLPRPCGPRAHRGDASTDAAAPANAGVGADGGGIVAPAPPPRPQGPSAADRRAIADAVAAWSELEPLLKRGLLTDKTKPGSGDATEKCERIDGVRPRLVLLVGRLDAGTEHLPTQEDGGTVEADLRGLLAASQRACSVDIPLLQAKEALDQATYPSSQASKLLACDLAQREIARARAAKAEERRLYPLDGRFNQTCR